MADPVARQVGWLDPESGCLYEDGGLDPDEVAVYVLDPSQSGPDLPACVEYDPEANAMYVTLDKKHPHYRTHEVGGTNVMVDVDAFGTVQGVEILLPIGASGPPTQPDGMKSARIEAQLGYDAGVRAERVKHDGEIMATRRHFYDTGYEAGVQAERAKHEDRPTQRIIAHIEQQRDSWTKARFGGSARVARLDAYDHLLEWLRTPEERSDPDA